MPVSNASVLFASLMVFSPLIDGGTTQFPVLVIRLLLLVGLTVWILRSMQRGEITIYRTRLLLPIVLFLAWSALSIMGSSYIAPSVQWIMSLISYAAMLFLVMHIIESRRQVRQIVTIVGVMGVVEATIGISQYLWLGHPRVTGTFFNPSFFASYEVAIFAVIFGLLCVGQQARFLSPVARWKKMILVGAAAVMGVAIVLAQSRGALLALLVAVSFIGFYQFGKVFVAVLTLVLVLGVVVPNPVKHRVLNVDSQDPYAFTRAEIWKNSLQRIIDKPWGEGMGMFKYNSFQYRFPIEGVIVRYGKRAESAHNEYLQIAVELGVVGFLVFLAGVAALSKEIADTLKSPLHPWERGLVVGLTGGLLGLFAHAAVDSVFHEPALVLLALLFIGVIIVLKRLRTLEPASIWTLYFSKSSLRIALVGSLATVLALVIIRPAAAWYVSQIADREVSAGHIEQGVNAFEWAIVIDPGTSAYRDRLALAQVHLFQYSGDTRWLGRAITELRIGLALNPLDSRLAHRLGGLHLFLAERAHVDSERTALLAQATSYYEKATKLDPYSPFNYLDLGRLQQEQAHVAEAEMWFLRAVNREPNFLPARVELVDVYLHTGRREWAAAEYAEILKIKKRYEGWNLTSVEREYLDIAPSRLRALETAL